MLDHREGTAMSGYLQFTTKTFIAVPDIPSSGIIRSYFYKTYAIAAASSSAWNSFNLPVQRPGTFFVYSLNQKLKLAYYDLFIKNIGK